MIGEDYQFYRPQSELQRNHKWYFQSRKHNRDKKKKENRKKKLIKKEMRNKQSHFPTIWEKNIYNLILEDFSIETYRWCD